MLSSVHVVVQELVIPQQRVVIVQIVLRNIRLGRMRYIIHLDSPSQVCGKRPFFVEFLLGHFVLARLFQLLFALPRLLLQTVARTAQFHHAFFVDRLVAVLVSGRIEVVVLK